MSEEIKQIAERLRGLRDVLEITVEEMAEVCRLTPEEYLRIESGTEDISIDMLHTIALLSCDELPTPHHSTRLA